MALFIQLQEMERMDLVVIMDLLILLSYLILQDLLLTPVVIYILLTQTINVFAK